MASSMSKRTQARNERDLHQLLSLPGNSQCADCAAQNPAWASWNLGVFLCMRCASLHRKLGTHISKVKSLSMDTWTAEQVESMKRNGNTAVNKIYNPKNRRPDMPLDADEVDSAMERFVRKKYQEKSLADGKPEPPRRDNREDYSPTAYSSRPPVQDSESPPPPPVPSKKGKIFGFGLRASSSAYPFSKSDKKKRAQEPRVDSAFPIPSRGLDSRMDDARYEMTDSDLQRKLGALRDMGFGETERNTALLRRLNGNVERVVETLIRQGPRENNSTTSRRDGRSATVDTSFPTAKAPEPSNNPYTQAMDQPTAGLSFAKPQEPSTPNSTTTFGSNNPFGPPERTTTGLEQSFQGMQVSQQPQPALFPNNTGGYPAQPPPIQDPRFQYSMTPPALPTQYQGFVASPPALPTTSNPFFQPTSVSAQSTGSNPFLPQPSQGPSQLSNNPFFASGPAQPQMPQRQVSSPATFNPFGIPPPQSSPHQQAQQPQTLQQDLFGTVQQQTLQQPNNPFQTQSTQQQAQPQLSSYQAAQTPSPFPNFQYAQPQEPAQQQQAPQTQMPQFQQQPSYHQQPQQQFSHPQQPFSPSQQQNPQLLPQQTGRHDKSSIMALYNYPQLGPQRLASIPEPAFEQHPPQQQPQQQQQYQQQISPLPTSDPFGNLSLSPAKRSATMPVNLSSMHSAGGAGNRNPFMTNNNVPNSNTNTAFNLFGGGMSPLASPGPQSQPQVQSFSFQNQQQPQAFIQQSQSNPFGHMQGQVQVQGQGFVSSGGAIGSTITYSGTNISSNQQRPVQAQGSNYMNMGMGMGNLGIRHTSNESMAVNNLDGGRHSPDAFASLSARYG